MTRRNPALPGVSGITSEDIDALNQGLVTLADLGSKLGCSKQAISRKVRAMRPASPTTTLAASTTSTSTGPSIPAPTGPVLIDVQQAVISVNLAVIHRAAGLLEGHGEIGPSAIKALAGAIALARAELVMLGVLTTNDDAEALTELTVRILTDAEHQEIKCKGELMANDDFED